jgi:hypothetical protein
LKLLLAFILFFVAAFVFFKWANHKTRVEHAKFDKKDVISALDNLILNNSYYVDEFELFVRWPISDPYLESIRNRSISIVEKFPGIEASDDEVNPAGIEEIKKLIDELRAR